MTFRNSSIAIIFHFFFFGSALFSQTPATTSTQFAYDLNGNRISRWVTINKIVAGDSVPLFLKDSNAVVFSEHSTVSIVQGRSIVVYPNPARGYLDLKIVPMEEGETATYTLYSSTGQKLRSGKTDAAVTQIDIADFPPGLYFGKITIGKSTETWRILKE